MVGRGEAGTRWTIRAQQARCDGSGPRYQIRHIRRKAASMKNKSGRHTRVLALYDIEMFMN